MGEPTPTTPTVDATAPSKPVLDALSALIGAGKARMLRTTIHFVVAVGAKHGLGLNADNPTTNLLLDAAVTGIFTGVGKALRDGSITIGKKVVTFPSWIPRLPGWFPL